ncbi:hypothetical protein OBV_p-00320 (plasmid) [Oscillibacter valericigenes Sjm18-20]|nr:hypothetical protein OBV_p-00320 [Oscillibacter valericigenes Sjm18-20]
MSDFGSEVGNAGLNMSGNVLMKLLDALLALLNKIYELIRERSSADYKLKKEQYGEAKAKSEHKKFVEKIEGKTGYANHKELVKAGVPLTACGISLDEMGMKELSERCKREDILFSGIEDMREREMNGNKMYIVECRQSDLLKMATLIDLMNDEKKIDRIDEEINKIKGLENPAGQPKDLSEEDKLVIEELERQKEEIRQGHSKDMNVEQGRGVCEKAVDGETQRGVSFSEALDRWTGGKIDKDTTCYVVDANDPSKYIVCTAKNDTYEDREYIKTDYQVYNGTKQVYATNDGRFDGRPSNYWFQEKAVMRDKGGMSDLVMKFYSLNEVEAYRENYKTQNETELNALQVGKEGRNYEAITSKLEAKLDECHAVYKDGAVLDKETGKALVMTDGMDEAKRAAIAEATVIGKQITNYKELSEIEGEIGIARSEALVVSQGTPEGTKAQEALDKIQEKYNAAVKLESSLIAERKNINAVQAEQEVRTKDKEQQLVLLPQDKEKIGNLKANISKKEQSLHELRHEIEFTEYPPMADKMRETADKAEKEIESMRAGLESLKQQAIENAKNAEKQDGGRDERVDGVNETHHTMAEYEGEINETKKDVGKGVDIKERETTKQISTPTSRDDR